MKQSMITVIGVVMAGCVSQAVVAAPVLRVTKPPLSPILGTIESGPSHDSYAEDGQWFRDLSSDRVDVRTHQFHDNVSSGDMAGGSQGSNAIKGIADNLVFNPISGSLMSFSIQASITNDVPSAPAGFMGYNSFGELRFSMGDEGDYAGPFLAARLAVPFAIGSGLTPPAGASQYVDSAPHIVAVNHSAMAWYGWTPGNNLGAPAGNYFVPTWDFGDIAPGQSVTRQLDFTVEGDGLPADDARTLLLIASRDNGYDLLASRSTGAKIASWISSPFLDDGSATPGSDYLSSDVAVFHNTPEPATVGMLALGGFAALGRRRRFTRYAPARAHRVWIAGTGSKPLRGRQLPRT